MDYAELDAAMREIEDMPAPQPGDWPACEAALPSAGGFDIGNGDAYGVRWQQCGRPATAVHRYMCVHEHWKVRSTCDEHAPEPGIVGCRECFELGHECPMTAELAGELT